MVREYDRVIWYGNYFLYQRWFWSESSSKGHTKNSMCGVVELAVARKWNHYARRVRSFE